MVTEKRFKYRRGLFDFGGGVEVELNSLSVGKIREGMEMSQPGCVQQEALGLLQEHRA